MPAGMAEVWIHSEVGIIELKKKVNRVVPNMSLSLNKYTETNQNIGTKIFGIHTHGDILVPVFWFVSVCLFRLKGLFGTTLLHFFSALFYQLHYGSMPIGMRTCGDWILGQCP